MHQKTNAPIVGKLALALCTGVAPGSNVRASRMFSLTPTELVFDGDPTQEQLLDAFALVKWMKKSAPVFLADVVKKSRKLYGDDWTSDAALQMEFAQFDMDRALAIGSIPTKLRHIALNEEHYHVLAMAAPGMNAAKLDYWARSAVEHSLSPLRLKVSIETGVVMTAEALSQSAGRNSGMANPHAFHQQFAMWRDQVGGFDGISKMPERDKRVIWAEMEEPVRLGMQLAKDLGINLEVK